MIDKMDENVEQQIKKSWEQIFKVNDGDRTIRINYIKSLPGETFDGHVSISNI